MPGKFDMRQFAPMQKKIKKLEYQNAKMLAFIKLDCADCKASSDATKAQCARCENGKLIAEIGAA